MTAAEVIPARYAGLLKAVRRLKVTRLMRDTDESAILTMDWIDLQKALCAFKDEEGVT